MEMLTTLRRIVQQVNQASELADALDLLVSETKRAFATDCCSVYLADYDAQQFLLMATDGLERGAVGRISIAFSEGLVGLVGQREEPINIAEAQQHPRFKYFPEVKEESFNAFLGAPIIHRRKVLGVLVIQQHVSRTFSDSEEAFLVTLSAQLAHVIASAEARGILTTQPRNAKTWVKCLTGIAGAPGVAEGVARVVAPTLELDSINLQSSDDPESERRTFVEAMQATREDIERLAQSISAGLSNEINAIFDVYKHLLADHAIEQAIIQEIEAGYTAVSAVKKVYQGYIAQFEAMSDTYLRERAFDVKDMAQRIIGMIVSKEPTDSFEHEQIVLVAKEVTASMLAEVPRERLVAIVSLSGSNNSHAAILARAMGLPAVLGVEDLPLNRIQGAQVIIDGYSGELYVEPGEAIRREYQRLIAEEQQLHSSYMREAALAATTPDGHEVRILLNGGLSADTELGQAQGADGIGLYRTEIPFLMQDRFPSEEAQETLYRQVLESFNGQPVTMRTLDVGGDKSLPYFPISEDNPFLGWRGVRLTLDHPEIFLLQIRAMLRASIGLNNLSIMFPMISSIAEVDEALRLTQQAYNEIAEELHQNGNCCAVLSRPKIGVMIEVPGIIYQMEALAERVDFFSIGTNDLTQYLLAVDRNNSRVASLYDSYHPAVLAALKHIFDESHRLGIPVSVCGELAGEPAGAILLMAMGYRQLSMNNQNIAKIKWVLRKTRFEVAQQVLGEVMQLESPSQIRAVMSAHLEQLGLGGLMRAGK